MNLPIAALELVAAQDPTVLGPQVLDTILASGPVAVVLAGVCWVQYRRNNALEAKNEALSAELLKRTDAQAQIVKTVESLLERSQR